MENAISVLAIESPLSTYMINEDHHWKNTNLLSGLSEEKKAFRILLIDSNADSGAFITDCLPDYKVSRAVNGADILQTAYNLAPNLIIVSATLPVMKSYECCKSIKEDKYTRHIPLILLMGKIMPDGCTEALTSGADDYLIEPFSPAELCLRVKKLFAGKHQLQRVFGTELHPLVTQKNTISLPADLVPKDPFLKKILAVIEEKLDDANFNVEELANRVCMSRANLHRKLKAITCTTPVDIINNYRLQRAAQFLKEGCNSSETAFKTGFNSPAYFTKCFREFYGSTPLEFSRQKL